MHKTTAATSITVLGPCTATKCCVSLALQGLQCRRGPGRMWWDEEAAVVPSGSLINLWYPVEAAIPSEVCMCSEGEENQKETVNSTGWIVGKLTGPVREHVRCSPGRLWMPCGIWILEGTGIC